VEQFEQVERAFVHVDYMRRDGLEHKVSHQGVFAESPASVSQCCCGASLIGAVVPDAMELLLASGCNRLYVR
jgi:hypothetical protein